MSIRHAILGVLRNGPMHGYQIGSELEHILAGGRFNSAQIYQGLRWLEERGHVIAEQPDQGAARERRPFSVTAQGRGEFQRWLRDPLVPARPLRDDVVIKLVFLGKDDPTQLIQALERLRGQHLRRLTGAEWGIPASSSNSEERPLAAELSAAALRFREQAELRWIEFCLLRLHSFASAEGARDGCDDASEENQRLAAGTRRR